MRRPKDRDFVETKTVRGRKFSFVPKEAVARYYLPEERVAQTEGS